MFLNNISDLDYETTKTILYSSKSTATFDECVCDVHAREDDLECAINEERKFKKIRCLLKIRRTRLECDNDSSNPKSRKIAMPPHMSRTLQGQSRNMLFTWSHLVSAE